MTTKHTPEPWYFNDEDEGITTEERKCKRKTRIATVTLGWAEPFNSEQLENARRIVACVNACEGISTEQLDSWLCMSRPIRKSLEELKAEADREGKQRDELLAALQRIAAGQEMSGVFTFADVVLRYQEIARAAIARATGESK